MSSVNELKEQFDAFLEDYEKFTEKGNKSAALRARKALLEVHRLCRVVRAEIQEAKSKR